MQALVEKYGVREDELRVYIHYQPSYYHLHAHFLHVKYDVGAGMAVGKAHLLNDIIGASHALDLAGRACMDGLLVTLPLMSVYRGFKHAVHCSPARITDQISASIRACKLFWGVAQTTLRSCQSTMRGERLLSSSVRGILYYRPSASVKRLTTHQIFMKLRSPVKALCRMLLDDSVSVLFTLGWLLREFKCMRNDHDGSVKECFRVQMTGIVIALPGPRAKLSNLSFESAPCRRELLSF